MLEEWSYIPMSRIVQIIGLRTQRRYKAISLTMIIMVVAIVILWQFCLSKRTDYIKSSVRPQNFPSYLQAPENASPVYYIYSNTAGNAKQLSFWIREPYPAKGVIDFISARLTDGGFHKLDYDLMNPELPSSRVSGWDEFADARRKPISQVYRWSEDWLNEQGETVGVLLEYRYPVEEDEDVDLVDLGVFQIWSKPTGLEKQFLDR